MTDLEVISNNKIINYPILKHSKSMVNLNTKNINLVRYPATLQRYRSFRIFRTYDQVPHTPQNIESKKLYPPPVQQFVPETNNNITIVPQSTIKHAEVNHCVHCCLCSLTCGLWVPCWILGYVGCCCEDPCNHKISF